MAPTSTPFYTPPPAASNPLDAECLLKVTGERQAFWQQPRREGADIGPRGAAPPKARHGLCRLLLDPGGQIHASWMEFAKLKAAPAIWGDCAEASDLDGPRRDRYSCEVAATRRNYQVAWGLRVRRHFLCRPQSGNAHG